MVATEPSAAGLLLAAIERLAETGSDTARLDAQLLLAASLGISRADLVLGIRDMMVADESRLRFEAMLARRCGHEPIAHILGYKEFWSLPFRVTADTLIPRPDSELLVDLAVQAGQAMLAPRVLDLGTGSGALLLATLHALPSAWGLGIDCSARAIRIASENAAVLGLTDRSGFMVADWDAALRDAAPFDLILANPPYIPSVDVAELMPDVARYEPHQALDGGETGLAPYPLLLAAIASRLSPGGGAWLEFGTGQAEALLAMARACGLQACIHRDLAGRPRCLAVSREPGHDFSLGKDC